MAGATKLGKGSRRKVRLVRWRPSEKLSMILLFIMVVIETVFIAWWLMEHSVD